MTLFQRLRTVLRPARTAAPTLLFLHVPKAAGRSFLLAAGGLYRPNEVFVVEGSRPLESIGDFRALSREKRDSYRFIGGHTYYGMHRLLGRPAVYATLLRDPVARTVSYYRYLQTRLDDPAIAAAFATRPDLGRFLQERLGATEMDNGQMRRLAGLYRAPYGTVSAAHLATWEAEMAPSFLLVGLTERFDESLLLLAEAAGWGMPFYVRSNETPPTIPTPAVTPALRALIAEYNQVDQQLYDMAAQRLEARIDAAGKPFQRRLRRFRRLNGIFGRAYRLLRPGAAR